MNFMYQKCVDSELLSEFLNIKVKVAYRGKIKSLTRSCY